MVTCCLDLEIAYVIKGFRLSLNYKFNEVAVDYCPVRGSTANSACKTISLI